MRKDIEKDIDTLLKDKEIEGPGTLKEEPADDGETPKEGEEKTPEQVDTAAIFAEMDKFEKDVGPKLQ